MSLVSETEAEVFRGKKHRICRSYLQLILKWFKKKQEEHKRFKRKTTKHSQLLNTGDYHLSVILLMEFF